MAAQNSLTNYFICSKKWILSGICIYCFKRKLAEGYIGLDSHVFYAKKIGKGGKKDENREVFSNGLFGINISYYRL
jgi:hypothetical protein